MFLDRFRHREEGFTFVELMVVVLIIGILVGIATMSFVFSVSTSKDTACKANLKTIREAVSQYYVRFRAYPPDLQALVPDYIENDAAMDCPGSGELYLYDQSTGGVTCPYHTDY